MAIHDHEQRWRQWLSTIDQDITTVFLFRATWLTVGRIVRANNDIRPSHFFAYQASIYGTSQALALRRLTDERRDVVSLARLVKDVRNHATEVTREWWLALQPGAEVSDFRQFTTTSMNHFDPAIADEDLKRLRQAVAPVKKYVDHHLAHHDRDPTKAIPTFGDIHLALDTVGAVFRRYYALLTGADRPIMVPVPQPGWHLPFTVPWLPPGTRAPKLDGTIG